MPDTYIHPGHITRNLAVEHMAGVLTGQRTVYGKDWISRFMASIYIHFLTGDTTAVVLEKKMQNGDPWTIRYSLTDDEPDQP